MPFTYRDKPKLADRFRGKSGEEILNELKSDLHPERRMFFDSPSWRTRHNNSAGFSRGFPFDDDRNRTNIRTYLDEIAARHPEFADQLKEPPWHEDFVNTPFGRKRRGSNSRREEEVPRETSGPSQDPPSEVKEPRQNLTNFGLRNTVPLGPGSVTEEERRQRSMSAPPDNRTAEKPKRFVTKCEIPVMHDPTQDSVPPKPDLAGKGASEQAQPKGNNAPNVRVIPIQVEGRDTPIVNTNIDVSPNFGAEAFRDASFDGRLPRDFGSYQRHSPRFTHKERAPTPPQYAPQYQQYAPPQHFAPPPPQPFMPQQHFAPPQQQHQQHFAPPQQQHPQQQPHFAPPQQQQQQQQFTYQQPHSQKPAPPSQGQPQQQQQQQQPPTAKPPQQSDETDSKPPPQPKPEPIKDPIEKVQMIQRDVEELMRQVESFNGKSRTDKQYLILDELLTRQLLLLDNIDTEGKENVRQVRKDAIRSIQRCISTLENKVPLNESNETSGESQGNQAEEPKGQAPTAPPQAMEVDQSKENTPVDNKESQKMEVDEKGSKEPPKPEEENKEKA